MLSFGPWVDRARSLRTVHLEARQDLLWGLGLRVWGLGFGIWGLGFGVWGLGFGVWGSEFGVWKFLLPLRLDSRTGPRRSLKLT